jgi:hypothetical protein
MKQCRCSKTRGMARVAQVGVLALLSVLAVEAWSQCTTRERIELRREGYSSREIEAICDDDSDDDRPVQRRPQPSFPSYRSPQDDDSDDDRPVQRRPRSSFPSYQPSQADICITQVGACPMRMAIPVGSFCQCYTRYGIFPGVAR